ncbi:MULTISPECIES: urease accessory protein UreE [Ciceribacter]|uniref:Urease accessory protein UreE n=1 Tax=Ciceribacter lividus TaxID=1197950 RepID=A0A6I7HQE0_9HYPH|nr:MULTISPECIES: urease accessory protein UreE [Ciceribacter]MCO6179220.1 urease accessory protein UreE [Ciceribacter sp. RN22]RCW28051.1 urease accessory protein [Ciceribacter lividus]
MQRITTYLSAGTSAALPIGTVVLAHDERHLRRKLLHLTDGDMVMLDLKEPVVFGDGDRLVLDNGDQVEIRAAKEPLYEIVPRDPLHLAELAWHLGNRHMSAQIEADRILILRDRVIREMIELLGARVVEIVEAFQPMRGAYHTHGDNHGHAHGGRE